jgi:predicted transcriptional regulator
MLQAKDIRELREHADVSQWRLSKATDIERSKISLIERGYVAPSAAELARIERALLLEVRRQSARLEKVLQSREEVGNS